MENVIFMKKIITCNLIYNNNFGCPSILYGIQELFRELYGNDFEIVDLEASHLSVENKKISENITISYFLPPDKSNIINFLFGKNGIKKIIPKILVTY